MGRAREGKGRGVDIIKRKDVVEVEREKEDTSQVQHW